MLDAQMWAMIWKAFCQTVTMVLWSTAFSVLLGFIPAVLLTLTVAVVGYYTAVKLQYLWSLRMVAVSKLKAAAMVVEEALLAASILKHKVLRGEITAAAASKGDRGGREQEFVCCGGADRTPSQDH